MTNVVVYLNANEKSTVLFYADHLSYIIKTDRVFPHADTLDRVTMSEEKKSDFTVIPKGLLIYG